MMLDLNYHWHNAYHAAFSKCVFLHHVAVMQSMYVTV